MPLSTLLFDRLHAAFQWPAAIAFESLRRIALFWRPPLQRDALAGFAAPALRGSRVGAVPADQRAQRPLRVVAPPCWATFRRPAPGPRVELWIAQGPRPNARSKLPA